MFISARKYKKDEMVSDYSDSFVSSRNRIKRKEYIEDNTSFVIEDLGTQLSVDKLDQTQELKLTLKNYKS